MDQLLISLTEAKNRSGFIGKTCEFKASKELIEYCIQHAHIVESVGPTEMSEEYYNYYFNYLVQLALRACQSMPDLEGVDDLKNRPSFRKSFKILWDFGVIGEIRNNYEGVKEDENLHKVRSPSSITIKELYEVFLVAGHFSGSELAFKKQVQKLYGSFAEYCLVKGYDINTSKWESDETAIRVARKIGSKVMVEQKSKSLAKFITENNLWDKVFEVIKAA